MIAVIITAYLVIGVLTYLLTPDKWAHPLDPWTGRKDDGTGIALGTVLFWPVAVLFFIGVTLVNLRLAARRRR